MERHDSCCGTFQFSGENVARLEFLQLVPLVSLGNKWAVRHGDEEYLNKSSNFFSIFFNLF